MEEYVVECEECESFSFVHSYDKIKFCPACGRRAEVEKRTTDLDWADEDE